MAVRGIVVCHGIPREWIESRIRFGPATARETRSIFCEGVDEKARALLYVKLRRWGGKASKDRLIVRGERSEAIESTSHDLGAVRDGSTIHI